MIKQTWKKIKEWSGWSAAGTIFMARIEMFLSVISGVVLGFDWSALLAMDFSNGFNKPVLIACSLLALKALLFEIVRRHNAKDL